MYGSISNEEYTTAIGGGALCNTPTTLTKSISCEALEGENLLLVLKNDSHNRPLETFIFQQCLGFTSNPIRAALGSQPQTRNHTASDLRLSMLSNFSTAYNIISISLALQILETTKGHHHHVNKSLCSSVLIAGMMVGQFCGGMLGDMFGRHVGMAVCLSLQVIGALGSALSFGHRMDIILAVWRFLLGIGCGGVYPLSATLTAESSSSTSQGEMPQKSVALSFAMQGVGYLVVPTVAWGLIQVVPSTMAWRLLLGFGSVPGVVITLLRVRQQRQYRQTNLSANAPTDDCKEPVRQAPISIWDAICMEENLIIKLVGTAGCWFLFDIMFYANTLFQPMVLSSAFGSSESIQSMARDACLIALMALPGYIVSIASIGRQSPRYIQLQGFFFMAVLYALLGCHIHELAQDHHGMLLILYGATFFCSNYGPNVTTFLLPSITFQPPCRSTLNGVCAACGKAGALIGTCCWNDSMEASRGFKSCAILSVVGWCMTFGCVRVMDEDKDKEMETTIMKRRKNDRYLESIPMATVHSRPTLLDWNDCK